MSRLGRYRAFPLLLLICQSASGAGGPWQGRPLAEYIESLQEAGLRIFYSSDLVLAEYRIVDEPTASDPEQALRGVLARFGLTLSDGPVGSLLVTKNAASVQLAIDTATEAGNTSEPVVETLPEIVVTSSLYNIRYEDAGSHTFLERDVSARLPDLGDDAVRAIARLPGTAGGGVSTRHHVRGGLQNEQLFLLDGLRLYEPYHMKDFQSIATIVDRNVISGIDFYSAGYQARYGDRMSGVVDISLREPPEETETELGISFFNTTALSRGRFGDDARGDWLFSARRGNLDLVAHAIEPKYGSPRYQDYLGHLGWQFRDDTYVAANALFSYDKITVSNTDDSEAASAKYQNSILWIRADSSWNDKVESSTILSATEIENARTGFKNQPGVIIGNVDDGRTFRSLAVKQDWQFAMSDRWLMSSGFEIKRLEADYRYDSALAISSPFDQILGNLPSESRSLVANPRGSQYAAYWEFRLRLGDRITLDAGIRWDQQTYTTASDDEQVSPRLNLLYKVGKNSELRLAFGEYYQAQEINELQINDGITEFYPAQYARHVVASFTHDLTSGVELRLEAYRKKYFSLMPRFENIFDSLVLIPELQIDRARIDADTAVAQGVEITVSGTGRNELNWWTSYSWSESEDRLDSVTIRRSWDQTHTFSAGVSRDLGKWSIGVSGLFHTGWPRTELITETIQNADGSTRLVAIPGPGNAARYPTFQSLDARVSRRFDVSRGDLTAFLEVTNVYDHENPCCTEYSVGVDSDGTEFVQSKVNSWLPLVPSMGVVWRF